MPCRHYIIWWCCVMCLSLCLSFMLFTLHFGLAMFMKHHGTHLWIFTLFPLNILALGDLAVRSKSWPWKKHVSDRVCLTRVTKHGDLWEFMAPFVCQNVRKSYIRFEEFCRNSLGFAFALLVEAVWMSQIVRTSEALYISWHKKKRSSWTPITFYIRFVAISERF